MINVTKFALPYIILIFCATIFNPTSAYHKFTSDRILRMTNSYFRPLVTKSFDQLIYVTFPTNYPEPRIRLESEKIGYGSCEINFASAQDTEFPLSLSTLSDGKLILSMVQYMRDNSLSFETNRGLLTLVIDPESCKFHSVLTSIDSSPVRGQYYKESIFVIPGEKEFDIFLMAGHANCSDGKACRLRYNEEGVLIGHTDFDLDLEDKDVDGWSVNSIEVNDLSIGYFYTVLTKNETIVKRLNKELTVTNILNLSKSFLFSDTNGAISRCRGVSNSSLRCDLYDSNLLLRSNAAASSIDAQSYKKYLRNIKLFNLADGGAVVFLVLQLYDVTSTAEDRKFATYFQNIDATGRPGKVSKFQDDICKDFNDVHLFKIIDNYCFSISCPDLVLTKCAFIDTYV